MGADDGNADLSWEDMLLGAGVACCVAACVATGPVAVALLVVGICAGLGSSYVVRVPGEWTDPEYPQVNKPGNSMEQQVEVACYIEASQPERSWLASLARPEEVGRTR